VFLKEVRTAATRSPSESSPGTPSRRFSWFFRSAGGAVYVPAGAVRAPRSSAKSPKSGSAAVVRAVLDADQKRHSSPEPLRYSAPAQLATSTLGSSTSSTCRRHMPTLFGRKYSHAANPSHHCCSSAARCSCVHLENEAAEAARNCQRVKVDVAASSNDAQTCRRGEPTRRRDSTNPTQRKRHVWERKRISNAAYARRWDQKGIPPNGVQSSLTFREALVCSDTAIAKHSHPCSNCSFDSSGFHLRPFFTFEPDWLPGTRRSLDFVE